MKTEEKDFKRYFEKTLKLFLVFLLKNDGKGRAELDGLIGEQKKSINQIVEEIKKIKQPKIDIPQPKINIPPAKITVKQPKIEVLPPKIEMADYTLMLDDILKILEKPNDQVKELATLLAKVPNADYFNEIIDNIKQIPVLDFDKKGRLKVAVDKVGGGGSSISKYLNNVSGTTINPATEEGLQEIVTEIVKGLIGNTQSDGSGTNYHITTDSSGRLHTRGFKNEAGDGRRMLVDDDRHGQVDVLSSIDMPFMTLIDDYTTPNKTYIGKAVAGAMTNQAVWQIKCLDETDDYLKIVFADGVSTFTKEWDNRTTYDYGGWEPA